MSWPADQSSRGTGSVSEPVPSLWQATATVPALPRRSLAFTEPAARVFDVAIVGAGYTGLWTAHYLHQADPSLRIALVDKHVAGFGASGRNGGWCSGLYPVSLTRLAAEHGPDPARRQYRALHAAVAEVGRVATEQGWPIDYAPGGTLSLARSRPQLARAEAEIEEARQFGFGPQDLRLLDADEAGQRVRASAILGAVYSPHCAALHPLQLVRSLAGHVDRFAPIFENTAATELRPGRVRTNLGDLRADVVIRATEGFSPSLKGQTRRIVPVYSLMVATEPLPADRWDEIGLAQRETFSDLRHLIIYGQRTADGRLAFGGRGAPYHFGSRVRPGFDQSETVFRLLRRTLFELFPQRPELRYEFAWGGPLGIARDWHPSVGFDRTTGLGWAGGYVGDGVSTSNLAGQTLADLVLNRRTGLTDLPWVNHQSRQWETEPVRWLAVNAGLRAMTWADTAERQHGRPSRLARLVNGMMGR